MIYHCELRDTVRPGLMSAMAVGVSSQMSYALGTVNSRVWVKPFMISEIKGCHRLSSISLSPPSLRHNIWGFQVSDSVYGSFRVSYKNKYCICRSSTVPTSTLNIHILKSAALALNRSYNALLERPLLLRLAPAVGIIVFAVWGLGPVLRLGRNLFNHDKHNWKKSRTRLVFTSYLQPLLLWAGATLLCRALDPIVLPSEISQAVKQRLLNFVRSLSTVLAFAYCLSSLIQQMQEFFMEKSNYGDTRNMGFQFTGRAVYSAVWIAAFSLFMELLGFSTQKWLTAGGLGTVLLTLAGREIFTNFLSSVMIHATRPFVVNEWIQTKIEGYEVSGTVEHVGWWSPTIIRGEDREAVHIPNHKFTVNVVRNLSQKTHWRIKTHLAISHLDANKINNIVADMRKVLAKNPQIEQQRLHRRVFLDNIDPENQALRILISCFVKTSHFEEYLCVKEAIFLDLLRVISHHRARLATPIRTVQKIYADSGTDNIPYADAIFTRSVTADRPLLLVEPSPRINGDEKAKPRAPGGRVNEEQGTKAPTTAASEAQQKKASTGDARSKGGKTDPSTSPTSPSSQVKPGGGDKTGAAPPESPTEQAGRPSFEDNIVLGVALEGSKRTLPIEEAVEQSAAPVETAKEVGAARNGNGAPPSSSVKERKE